MPSDDDYEPALDMDAPPAPAELEAEVIATNDGPPPPDSTSEPRGQRVRSDKNRAMFRELASKVKAGEVTIETEDDLVPVEHAPVEHAPAAAAVAPPAAKPTPVVAPAAVPATASPAAQAAAAIPAPAPGPVPRQTAPPAGMPSIPQADTRLLELERREAALKEREAALDARAKKLPSRERLIEAPVPTLAEFIKESYGITDDAELKDTITDFMSEMAEQYHGVKLPEDIKARVDGRKALRSVKAIRVGLDAEKASLVEREAEAKKQAETAREKSEISEYERKAVGQLATLLQPAETTYPYLAVQDGAPAIVWEVIKAAHDQGHKIDWAEAAKFANDHFKSQHEQAQAEAATRAARLQTLLAPGASPAPARPTASPGGAPGPAPTQPAPAAQPKTPKPTPATDPADEIIGEDRRESRARSLRALRAKHGLVATEP